MGSPCPSSYETEKLGGLGVDNPIVIDDEGCEENKDTCPPVDLGEPIIIDERGDLWLNVVMGDGRQMFKVESRALARSSNFWDTLISESRMPPGVASGAAANRRSRKAVALEADGITPSWEVCLRLPQSFKDDIPKLSTLLNVAHGRMDRVPKEQSVVDLKAILILTNKCGMTPIMRSHVQTWFAAMKDLSSSFEGGLNLQIFTQLRIYWEYGSERDFQRVGNVLAWHCQATSEGDLVVTNQLSGVQSPLANKEAILVTGLYETIRQKRMQIIRLALKQLQTKIDVLQGPMPGTKRPHESSEQCSCVVARKLAKECDAYQYGLLVQELRKKRVNAHCLPPPEAIRKSPVELTRIFEDVHDALEARTAENSQRFQGHEACNPLASVIATLKERRDKSWLKLTGEQMEHFRTHSVKMEIKEQEE